MSVLSSSRVQNLIYQCTRKAESTLSDDEDSTGNDSDTDSDYGNRQYSFPELDVQIRKAISEYGAVFPKLNFSSARVSIG